MAVNTEKVFVGIPDRVTGAVMSAPRGSVLPTDSSEAPDAAFIDSGYITEDGCTLSDSQSWTDIKDWGGDTVRRIKSSSDVTVATSFLEVNEASAKAAFGENNVTIAPGSATAGEEIAIKINVNEPERKSWIINMLDGERHMRIVIPDGQITDRGDMTFTRQGAVVMPVTIAASPDANGDAVLLYANDGVLVGP